MWFCVGGLVPDCVVLVAGLQFERQLHVRTAQRSGGHRIGLRAAGRRLPRHVDVCALHCDELRSGQRHCADARPERLGPAAQLLGADGLL